MLARDVYFWAWPMVNVYNRRLAFSKAPEPGIMNDLPFAPLNRLAMLSDYVAPAERWVACPNQDVVYGASIVALDQSPAVVQVPDFGKRFWVYQVVDLRTDSFADIGAMQQSPASTCLWVLTGRELCPAASQASFAPLAILAWSFHVCFRTTRLKTSKRFNRSSTESMFIHSRSLMAK